MVKKLLFIFFFGFSTMIFSQEKSVLDLSAAPNPFSNNTTITFTSNKDSKVIFVVKNVLGKTIHKETVKTKIGKNSIPFSKGNLKTGIYIYSIQNEENIISKRFVIK